MSDWKQPSQVGVPVWEEPTLHSQPPRPTLLMPCATIAAHAPENSTAAMLENILARFARIESRWIEHEQRAAATLPLRPEPDPPDGPPLYTAAQQPYQPYTWQQPPSSGLNTHWYPHPPPPPNTNQLSPPYTHQQPPRPTADSCWYPPNPSRPSCWHPPTPAFDQPPNTYMESYAPLQIPYAGDHREQPDYSPRGCHIRTQNHTCSREIAPQDIICGSRNIAHHSSSPSLTFRCTHRRRQQRRDHILGWTYQDRAQHNMPIPNASHILLRQMCLVEGESLGLVLGHT